MMKYFSTIFNQIKPQYNLVKIRINDINSFNELNFKIIKILYYNNIKYDIIKNNEYILINLNTYNKRNHIEVNIFNQFKLNDLYKIINLDILDSDKYLSDINKKLSTFTYN